MTLLREFSLVDLSKPTEPEERFFNECLGVPFQSDPLHEKLVDLWLDYYRESERYDRTVCTGSIGRDGILPATLDQRELVIANSKHLLYNLHVAADKLLYRMPKEEALRALHKAKKAASRMPVNLNEKHNEDKERGSTS